MSGSRSAPEHDSKQTVDGRDSRSWRRFQCKRNAPFLSTRLSGVDLGWLACEVCGFREVVLSSDRRELNRVTPSLSILLDQQPRRLRTRTSP